MINNTQHIKFAFTLDFIKGKKNGFSLIELIIVLGIIIILVVTAIPKIYYLTTMKLIGAANKIASDIRYSQQLAISKQSIFGIKFESGLDKYSLFRDNESNIIDNPFAVYSSRNTPGERRYIVDFKNDDSFKNVTYTLNLAINILAFDPWGRPITDIVSKTELNTPLTIKLKYGSDEIELTISPQTGNVQIRPQ